MTENISRAAKHVAQAARLARDAHRATPPPPPMPPRPAFRRTPMHVLHLVLTVCTGGLWGIAWLFSIWSCREFNRAADTIDEANRQRYAVRLERHEQAMARWFDLSNERGGQ